MPENNGTHADDEGGRNRPYIVLEERSLLDVLSEALKHAEVGLASDEWDRLEQATASLLIYRQRGEKVPSRNSAHALTQVGRTYEDEGLTPPLVAVSERMFKPRKVNVSFDPRVTLS